MCSRESIQANLTKLTGLTAIQTGQPISNEEKVFEPRPILRKEAHGQTKIQYYLFNQGDINFQDPALQGKFHVIGDFLAQRASNAEMFPFDDVIVHIQVAVNSSNIPMLLVLWK